MLIRIASKLGVTLSDLLKCEGVVNREKDCFINPYTVVYADGMPRVTKEYRRESGITI